MKAVLALIREAVHAMGDREFTTAEINEIVSRAIGEKVPYKKFSHYFAHVRGRGEVEVVKKSAIGQPGVYRKLRKREVRNV